MYRILKFFENRNGKDVSIPVRKFSSRLLAEFFAASLSVQTCNSNVLICIQRF